MEAEQAVLNLIFPRLVLISNLNGEKSTLFVWIHFPANPDNHTKLYNLKKRTTQDEYIPSINPLRSARFATDPSFVALPAAWMVFVVVVAVAFVPTKAIFISVCGAMNDKKLTAITSLAVLINHSLVCPARAGRERVVNPEFCVGCRMRRTVRQIKPTTSPMRDTRVSNLVCIF